MGHDCFNQDSYIGLGQPISFRGFKDFNFTAFGFGRRGRVQKLWDERKERRALQKILLSSEAVKEKQRRI